jgi:hypothetical protein
MSVALPDRSLEVGISSSYHIAKFFGLTSAGLRYAALANRVNAGVKIHQLALSQ